MEPLKAEALTLSYKGTGDVVHDLSVKIPLGAVTSIIGPNGCGKSTLLRALSRLLKPRLGTVFLDGEEIHRRPAKEVARRLGLLTQQPLAPEAITVEDLVSRGRYPHQSFLRAPTERDSGFVERALELAGMVELRHRPVDELSGGQRQRAWIAMTLAQDTPILLMDEPTTFLDIAHQQEVLNLILKLNRKEGRTVVLVLHDINNAVQVSDHVMLMQDGRIIGEGPASEVVFTELLEQVFGVPCDVLIHPLTGHPVSMPRGSAPRFEEPRLAEVATELKTANLTAGYNGQRVVKDVSVTPPAGSVTAVIGPNACGKSTMLRAMSRLLEPMGGAVLIDGRPVSDGTHRSFARRLSILNQEQPIPSGFLVEDLAAVGRYPFQSWYRQWSNQDQRAVDRALEMAGVFNLRMRPIDQLSGGQRQRARFAMSLAQDTPVLLLDEPTTFLDIAHQVEILDMMWELNRREGRTIIMALHDIWQASRYADYLIAMKEGRVIAAGSPGQVVTPTLVRDLFDLDAEIVDDPVSGKPFAFPLPPNSEKPSA